MSLTSSGSVGGQAKLPCVAEAFLLVAAGALLLTHSGTALKSELGGVGLFLTPAGTAFDGRTFNIHVCFTLQSHSRFAFSGEREEVCGSTNSQSE